RLARPFFSARHRRNNLMGLMIKFSPIRDICRVPARRRQPRVAPGDTPDDCSFSDGPSLAFGAGTIARALLFQEAAVGGHLAVGLFLLADNSFGEVTVKSSHPESP